VADVDRDASLPQGGGRGVTREDLGDSLKDDDEVMIEEGGGAQGGSRDTSNISPAILNSPRVSPEHGL